jgi:hypothetical protein
MFGLIRRPISLLFICCAFYAGLQIGKFSGTKDIRALCAASTASDVTQAICDKYGQED